MKLLTLICAVFLFVGCASAQKTSAVLQKQSGYAEVNGLKMYYEIHGQKEGTPLVLLHGGGSSIEITFSKVLPYLSAERKVIAIDEQAHGRSGDRPWRVDFQNSADDVAALLKSLKVAKADVMGFSNGATVAMEVSLRHPELVRKLVFISSFTKRSGAQPGLFEFLKKATFADMPSQLKETNLKLYNDPERLKVMHDKDLERIRNFKDTPEKAVKSLRVPTLIVSGDRDAVRLEHLLELNKLIPNSRLLIVPGGHGDFLGELGISEGESSMPKHTAGMINNFLGSP